MTKECVINMIDCILGDDILCNCVENYTIGCNQCRREAADMAIKALQEQKTGKWQKYEGRFDYNWECSECGCSAWEKTDYCAHCGARMECEEE
ncbi:MAG: hypothetical protein IKN65_06675 [Clostridia bacterium]|nr:hypothetical protein [Clostridia bacterium]